MKFATGRWAVWNDRVGVISQLHKQGAHVHSVTLHLVDERGHTVEERKSSVNFVRLAEPHEIPAARRPIIAKKTWKDELWHWYSQMVAKILR